MTAQNIPPSAPSSSPTPTPRRPLLFTVKCQSPDSSNAEYLIRVYAASPCAGELLRPRMVSIPVKEINICDTSQAWSSPHHQTLHCQPGDEIYARTNYWRPGSARDYTIANTEELARRAKNLAWAESAAMPLSAETA